MRLVSHCGAPSFPRLLSLLPARPLPQALVYRLRQDVAAAGQDASLFDKLKEVRTLEYEVDYLTNKVKVGQLLLARVRAGGRAE